MAEYVDGFLLPVPKKNMKAYKTLASKASKIWREYGALDYRECWGEDLAPGFGVSFTKLAKCKPGETVVFSWIVYKSKAHRDSVNKKIMSDPRMAKMCDPKNMPFDCKRMGYGGFGTLVKG
ncbi:MAG TPA: DUF1428 domain-containing protein [Phycisphaerales bacterium]|nr:DUF1428 domain-containing protein [Phycisphaerales bacterium]